MLASQTRMIANPANAAKSTGPRTVEGKEKSRQNALKHGLTGDGVVLIEEDAAEVEQMARTMESELQPSGTMGRVLIRRMATLAVRLDRSADQETAALSDRVRRVQAEFVPPEGVDAETAAKLRLEAGRAAMFDPSREATLARKYEAAAERGLFRALKEFRQLERDARASRTLPGPASSREALGSFLPLETIKQAVREFEAPRPIKATSPPPSRLWEPGDPLWNPKFGTDCDVPITIGKPR